MRILAVASEIYPFIKTGGLADVTGALPRALSHEGIKVRTLVPGYPKILGALDWAEPAHTYSELFGGPARILLSRAAGLELFVFDAPHLYRRDGNPYLGANGRDWPDNAFRFAALARVAAAIGRGLLPEFVPDLVHAHDWQAGLTPAYLRLGPGPAVASVVTIHNIAFQGLFPAELLSRLHLPPATMNVEGVEFHGKIGFLKAGLYFADAITTVSPTYANEIQTSELGMGLEGLLRRRASVLRGICNGIDTHVWNPTEDHFLAKRFGSKTMNAKASNKAALKQLLGLASHSDGPLFGVISRLTEQKGMDVVLASMGDLVGRGAQLALLGTGDRDLEAAFVELASRHQDSIGVRIGYDEPLAHLIQGGSDALLVPSRFEPCGLTQLAALRYGTVPIVARVGGLADTIIDANEAALAARVATGIQFWPLTGAEFLHAIDRALAIWGSKDHWLCLQRNAMRADVGWDRAARSYAELFKSVAATVKRRRSVDDSA
jgi:starch synthase